MGLLFTVSQQIKLSTTENKIYINYNNIMLHSNDNLFYLQTVEHVTELLLIINREYMHQ